MEPYAAVLMMAVGAGAFGYAANGLNVKPYMQAALVLLAITAFTAAAFLFPMDPPVELNLL